ncbi:unnamed protein product [Euphydryas editha]|uniref:Reverse transcriptase n=1 Tax=Euphydryas editha TaxID=104508 RepID=A0AAU9TJW8_EUPED|nr:unnamed protein product [Euphydryas editha]
MCNNSDKYSTYAEYARRSLLRLRAVRGLSDELLTAIIIRGITDVSIRAAATNAKLLPDSIVEFLSIYVKPKTQHNSNTASGANNRKRSYQNLPSSNTGSNSEASISRKRRIKDSAIRCFTCGRWGHGFNSCPVKSKLPPAQFVSNSVNDFSNNPQSVMKCSFCKKSGHDESTCFAKERSESRNKGNVNFCREIEGTLKNRDVVAAVLCGIPVDVLIDSGSYISLISSDLLKHFPCKINSGSQMLRGLGGIEIHSTSFVTLPIELSEISLEVDFYIVPHNCLSTPVIIGTDVLNRKGVLYIRTADSQRIVRKNRAVNSVARVRPGVQVDQINTPVVGDNKKRLVKILDKYSDYFLTGTATTTVKTGQMHIRLTSDTPINYRPYKLSYDEKLRVRAIVRDLLDKKIIRESESEYASPVLLVRKKDGSDRMVVDFRALNQLTIKDRYPLPLIEDHVDRLGNSKFYSALDMVTGFHQISLSEDSIPKTAFVTPEGHYEYLKMPYGLANAPVVYQRIISETLKTFIESGRALVYMMYCCLVILSRKAWISSTQYWEL